MNHLPHAHQLLIDCPDMTESDLIDMIRVLQSTPMPYSSNTRRRYNDNSVTMNNSWSYSRQASLNRFPSDEGIART